MAALRATLASANNTTVPQDMQALVSEGVADFRGGRIFMSCRRVSGNANFEVQFQVNTGTDKDTQWVRVARYRQGDLGTVVELPYLHGSQVRFQLVSGANVEVVML